MSTKYSNVVKSSLLEMEKIVAPSPEAIEALQHEFETPWVLWKQTKIKHGYDVLPLCYFHTIAGMWCLLNSHHFPKYGRTTIMRNGIEPKWEDPSHETGGQFIINEVSLSLH